MDLLPKPKETAMLNDRLELTPSTAIVLLQSGGDAALLPATQLADEIEECCGFRPCIKRTHDSASAEGIVLSKVQATPAEAYTLNISSRNILLEGHDDAGLYYAAQTLRQAIRQYGAFLPRLRVRDEPAMAVRGFYHDITRGKVPSLATLMALVEKLAHYKINQLQLYMEHTFAFSRNPEIWAGVDPLTHEEILRLDQHCRRHHIELAPSLSTFGHCYMILRTHRNEALNELPIRAARTPFSFRDRQLHYTLDCANPRSLELVKTMIDEYAPLFSSDKFNICCDETFDLGKGRNQQAANENGTGRLYMDFLKKIMDLVRDHQRIPMYWGDIMLHHPELIDEAPKDGITLNWCYQPELPPDTSRVFRDAGLSFYVCPGVHGWSRWFNNIDAASLNIVRFAREGLEYGAQGLLNTDWGDFGHINFLANSYHGMALGAAAAWNLKPLYNEDFTGFDQAFSRVELGDVSGLSGQLLRRMGACADRGWGDLVMWLDSSTDIPPEWRHAETRIPDSILKRNPWELLKAWHDLDKLRHDLADIMRAAKPDDPLAFQEHLAGARAAMNTLASELTLIKAAGRPTPNLPFTLGEVADAWRQQEVDITRLWNLRNKPSEYHRVRTTLVDLAEALDGLAG